MRGNFEAESRVETFIRLLSEDPTFICVVCNKCVHANHVQRFYKENYDSDLVEKFSYFDCTTLICHLTFKKREITCAGCF